MSQEQRQEIESVTREVEKNPNYSKEKLEHWLNLIVSKTSKSDVQFRIRVNGYTESGASKTRSLRITHFKHDIGQSMIMFKVQLAGQAEKWMVIVYLKKELQPKAVASEFLKELKSVAKLICEEEAKRLSDHVKKQIASDGGKGKDQANAGGDEQSKESKEARIKTADIITANVILDILRKWLEKCQGLKKISQREFCAVLDEAGVDPSVNKSMIVNFLAKKGVVIKTTPLPRQPVVEMTEAAFDLLKKDEELKKRDEAEKQSEELARQIFLFPSKVSSSLGALQVLISLCHELEKTREAKETILKQIADLEKNAADLDKVEATCLKKIEETIRSVDSKKVAEMVETIQNLT